MTKPSVSIRELLDESLVEQLTGELAAPPKQGVLLHRIALAAACLLLVAGIAGVGLWASRQSPAILGPTSAVSEEASSPSSSDDWQRMLAAMLPPTQAALPETGDTLPVAERPLLTMEEMRGRLQDFCREQGLIILEETTSPVCVSMGEDLRYILARVADNPLAIRQAAALTPDEAVSLWEQGTYLHMYPPAYMEEPPRERARVLRVRLEYWEQADQAVRLPVYILYVAAGAHEDVFRYAVPAVSAADADWNDLRLYINDGTVRGTWVRDE